ncbi:MAG: hypothetical protein HDR11_07375 [Lachnospiraceae bacterium]|nr:hypothetical protein [Lachnospiraceae bacterium]
MNINQTLLKTIEKLLSEKLNTIYYDKTFPTVIYGVNNDGTYQIVREGQLYTVPNGLGIPLKITQSVWVTMPCGNKNLKDMYISAIRGNLKS